MTLIYFVVYLVMKSYKAGIFICLNINKTVQIKPMKHDVHFNRLMVNWYFLKKGNILVPKIETFNL